MHARLLCRFTLASTCRLLRDHARANVHRWLAATRSTLGTIYDMPWDGCILTAAAAASFMAWLQSRLPQEVPFMWLIFSSGQHAAMCMHALAHCPLRLAGLSLTSPAPPAPGTFSGLVNQLTGLRTLNFHLSAGDGRWVSKRCGLGRVDVQPRC